MLFKFTSEMVDVLNHVQNFADLQFRFDSPITATANIRRNYPEGQQPSDPSSVVCISTTTGEIADAQCSAEIQASMLTPLESRYADLRLVDKTRLAVIWAEIDRFFTPLQALTESTVGILRWRLGLSYGPNDPLRNRREFISNDGANWFEFSMVRSIQIRFLWHMRAVPASIGEDVVNLGGAGGEEPLGHQLLREALHQRDSNPRSALVIGVAAAEVGLKKLIGLLVPKAQWLVDEIQTPPFAKTLRRYLPSLPIKAKLLGKVIGPPGVLVKTLERAVECRNDVVHAGKAPPNRDELAGMLRSVEDLLWMCDLYSGHVWAAEYISAETRIAWKNE